MALILACLLVMGVFYAVPLNRLVYDHAAGLPFMPVWLRIPLPVNVPFLALMSATLLLFWMLSALFLLAFRDPQADEDPWGGLNRLLSARGAELLVGPCAAVVVGLGGLGIFAGGFTERTAFLLGVAALALLRMVAISRTGRAPEPLALLPPPVEEFAALPGHLAISLRWRRPLPLNLEKVVVVRGEERRRPREPGDGTLVYEGDREEFLDQSLTPGIAYSYAAFAVAPRIAGRPTHAGRVLAEARTLERLPTLRGFEATGEREAVVLRWQDPAESGAPRVTVRKRLDQYPAGPDDGDLLYRGSGTSTVDRDARPGETVHYAAFPQTAAGEYGTASHANAAAAFPPDASEVTAAELIGCVELSWEPPRDEDIALFELVRRDADSGDTVELYRGLGTSFRDTTATRPSRYTLRVGWPNGAWSAGVSIGPFCPKPMVQPSNLIARSQPGAVHLTWVNPQIDTWRTARVVRRTDRSPEHADDGDLRLEAPVSEFVDEGLVGGQRVYYGVFADDVSGHTSPPARVEAVPLWPPPVANVEGVVTDGGVHWRWELPRDVRFEDVVIDRAEDGGTPSRCFAARATSFVDPNIMPGHTYTYVFTARSRGGSLSRSLTYHIVVPDANSPSGEDATPESDRVDRGA